MKDNQLSILLGTNKDKVRKTTENKNKISSENLLKSQVLSNMQLIRQQISKPTGFSIETKHKNSTVQMHHIQLSRCHENSTIN